MAENAIAYVNGIRHNLPGGRGECTLLQFLRGESALANEASGKRTRKTLKRSLYHPIIFNCSEIGLTGTKLGCGEGGCGACTVMLSHWEFGKVVHRSVNACLCPLYAIEGMHVITVEGEVGERSGVWSPSSFLSN